MQDFQECQRRFRGLRVIDYTQLGIPHKLYLCEVSAMMSAKWPVTI